MEREASLSARDGRSLIGFLRTWANRQLGKIRLSELKTTGTMSLEIVDGQTQSSRQIIAAPVCLLNSMVSVSRFLSGPGSWG
jgi:hypothetical protein